MLVIIQVGHNEASDRYIRNKVRAITQAGMTAKVINLPDTCETEDVVNAIFDAHVQRDCKAIMVQLPLPNHIDKNRVLESIPEDLDIDGLNPQSSFYSPLTPCAIMRWLKEQNISLGGKNVVILGRSELVGKPLANMMIDAHATVVVCHSKTPPSDITRYCENADIVVSAVGQPRWLNFESKRNAIVIDVGINRDESGKLCGDVGSVQNASYVTPVPGGVGLLTRVALLDNTVTAYRKER